MNVQTTTTLSKLDIKAMRQAEKVCFYHDRENGGYISLIKEVKNPGPFQDTDRRYRVNVDSSVRAYDPLGDSDKFWGNYICEQAKCSSLLMWTSADYCPWTAISSLVREGDQIKLKWTANPCNDYMRKANASANPIVHFDTLELQISRKNRVMFTIPVDHSHCHDNSARMIKF